MTPDALKKQLAEKRAILEQATAQANFLAGQVRLLEEQLAEAQGAVPINRAARRRAAAEEKQK